MMKKILVTGTSKGIGLEIVKRLLKVAPEFDKIIMTDFDEKAGRAAFNSLNGGSRLDFHVLDVSTKSSIERAKNYVQDKYKVLDVLVNNAGIAPTNLKERHKVIPQTLAVNTFGTIFTSEAFLPIMSPDGHIVNVTAGLGLTQYLNNPVFSAKLLDKNLTFEGFYKLVDEVKNVGPDWKEKGWDMEGLMDFGPYNHSKALSNTYIRLLAQKLKQEGSKIRVNALHPGWVQTDMGGPNGTVKLEDAGIIPVTVIQDKSSVSGMFYTDGNWENFS